VHPDDRAQRADLENRAQWDRINVEFRVRDRDARSAAAVSRTPLGRRVPSTHPACASRNCFDTFVLMDAF